MRLQAQKIQAHDAQHAIKIAPCCESRALALRLPWDVDELDISLDCGQVYRLVCHTNQQAESIIEQLEQRDDLSIISRDGGLLSHLSVRENLCLPSAYHGSRSSLIELESAARDFLSACGIAQSDDTLDQWMGNSPAALNRFEKRLVAFVRALLSRPEILVFDHVFEGLTRSEIDHVHVWRRVFQRQFPFRTLIFIDSDFNGLPELRDCVSVAAPAEH